MPGVQSRVCLWVLGVACASCVTVRAPTAVTLPSIEWPADTQVRWYDINGQTALDMRRQLNQRGPADSDGRHHDAYTEWYVTWRFPFATSEAGCSTGPVSTDIRINVSLPRWLEPVEADQALVAQWRQYLSSLLEHERGHRETGLRAANEISELLPALDPQPTCAEAEAVANELAHSVLNKYRRVDLQYDDETRHGATQGAVFP